MKQGDRPGLDWEQFEKFMSAQLPFMPKNYMKNRMRAGGDWIGEYVQDVLKRSFSERGLDMEGEREEQAEREERAEVASAPKNGLDYHYEIFETHTGIIVRVTVPEGVHVKNIRVYASSTQLKLEQDPSRHKMYIKLPGPADASAVRAVHKERVLEIRLNRLEEAEIFQEVRVRHL